MASNFYKTRKWKEKREKTLRRDGYECRECKRYGKTKSASTVHHIYPVRVRPDLRLMSINLISLCATCHGKMHDRQTDELTDLGMQWVERISPHLHKYQL